MKETKDNRARFERQRRNLIIISFLLITYICLNLELTRINVLGNSFEINNPENIEVFIWVLFIYFFIRYYQYYRVVNRSEFLSIYNTSMDIYVPHVAFKELEKQDKNRIESENPEGFDFKYNPGRHEIYSRYPWSWNVKINGDINWTSPTGGGTQRLKSIEYTISGKKLLWPKLRSHINVYLHSPHVTEYLLPFIISLIAITVKLIS